MHSENSTNGTTTENGNNYSENSSAAVDNVEKGNRNLTKVANVKIEKKNMGEYINSTFK